MLLNAGARGLESLFMSSQTSPDYRKQAAGLVLGSAFVLFFISAPFQFAAWEFRGFYEARGIELNGLCKLYLVGFGHRPDCYLIAAIFWLWWPFVVSLIYCNRTYRSSPEFAIRFLYWFVSCWLLAGVVLTFFSFLCVFPAMAILLSDLAESPPAMRWVMVVSWTLPVAVLAYAIWCGLQLQNQTSKAEPEKH